MHLLRQSVTKNFKKFCVSGHKWQEEFQSINRILEAKFILRIVDSTVTTTDVYSIVYTWSFFLEVVVSWHILLNIQKKETEFLKIREFLNKLWN